MSGKSWMLGVLVVLLVGSVLFVPSARGAPVPPPSVPQPPYFVAGTIYLPGGVTPATNANVWVNDTTAKFSLTATSNAVTGQYQVDLSSGSAPYANGDNLFVNATLTPNQGSCTTTVDTQKAGSFCNVTLAPTPLYGSLAVLPNPIFVGQPTTLWGNAGGGLPPYAYNFTFGDGTPHVATAANQTTHSYGAPGTFTAGLILNDSNAPPDSVSFTQAVNVVAAPTNTLSFLPATPRALVPVTFTSTLSLAGKGWVYYFASSDASSSGYTAAGVNTWTHSYAAAGSYTVNATAWNVSNGFRVDSNPVTVPVSARLAVSLAVTASPTTEVGYNNTYAATATNNQGTVNYYFGFGDGSSAGFQTSNKTAHTYAAAGNLTANVTAKDTGGPSGTAQASVPLAVVHAVGATIAPSVTSGAVPLTVSFRAYGFAGVGPYTYTVSYGDGSATTGYNLPTHTYNTTGSYVASVRVVDALGLHAWAASATITVSGVPPSPLYAHATGTPLSGTAPLTVALTCWGVGGVGPYTYSWRFGDGSVSVASHWANHTYAGAGSFVAEVWVNDSASHSASALVNVTVNAVPPLAADLYGAHTGSTNQSLSYTVDNITGGSAPFVLAYNFEDGTGWTVSAPSSATRVVLTHSFALKGTYTLLVYVNDSSSPHQSKLLSWQTVVSVASSTATPSPWTQFMPGGSLFPVLLLLILLLVIILIVLAVRRRKKKEEPAPPAAEAAAGAEGAGAAGAAAAATEAAPEASAESESPAAPSTPSEGEAGEGGTQVAEESPPESSGGEEPVQLEEPQDVSESDMSPPPTEPSEGGEGGEGGGESEGG